MTKLTLENKDGVYSVQLDRMCMNIHDVMQEIVGPVLLAAGYHPDHINEYLTEEQFS